MSEINFVMSYQNTIFHKKKKNVNKLSNISSNRGNSDICNIHVLLKKKEKKKETKNNKS